MDAEWLCGELDERVVDVCAGSALETKTLIGVPAVRYLEPRGLARLGPA